MFNFFRKHKSNTWDKLSPEKRLSVTSKLSRIVRAMSGARYKLVTGSDQYQREGGIGETESEDQILDFFKRGKLLDLSRNSVRNNSTFNTILKQFDYNAVGNQGGKAVITFGDKEYARDVREAFALWTRNADFFDGLNLNTLLKVILKTEIIGGDLVLLFDDNIISDSGRVLLFEPDEIGNTTDDALFERYGKKAKQSLGRVYNEYGQFQGVIVSKSQRGQQVFNPSKSYLLKRDPNGCVLDDLWMMPRNIWRISQGRGVTQATSSLATLIDLQDYLGFELASAKKNAQTLAVVNQVNSDETETPTAFDTDGLDINNMTDEQIERLVEEQEEEVPTMTLDAIRNAGAIYQVMPENYKLELLDTKHPNVNSIEFVRWLANASGASFGLGSCFTQLKCDASYSAFKGEQLLSQPAFEECQHFLEQILDWVFYRWSRWAVRTKRIEDRFPDNFLRNVSWEFPKMKDIDQVKEQNAISLKIRNNTSSLRDILGSDWQEKLLQISEEINFCREHNIPHPALQTVSGQVLTDNDIKTDADGQNEQR